MKENFVLIMFDVSRFLLFLDYQEQIRKKKEDAAAKKQHASEEVEVEVHDEDEENVDPVVEDE